MESARAATEAWRHGVGKSDRERVARWGGRYLSGRCRAGLHRALARERQGARTRDVGSMSASRILGELSGALTNGGVRVVDLSQTLSARFPQIVLPPEFDQCAPFRIEEISRYDERGPAWYWNNLSFGEHTGTHFDAPIHWITGRDLPNNATDTMSPVSFVAPACVVDCVAESARDADFLLTADHLRAWEARHGRIPARAWALRRADWSNPADPGAYQNLDETGQH